MNIQFSTNCPHSARERLVQALGKYASQGEEFIAYTCGLVERGLMRIGDPMMYGGNAPAFPMESMSAEQCAEYKAEYDKFVRKCAVD
jgi:hypothetical protein